jgi:dTDP-glucose 4,6-dehydratase
MKTYLVTGGAGFIGSNYVHLLFELYGDDVRVVNVDSLTYAGNIENLRSIQDRPNYRFVQCDICDRDTLRKAVESESIDYVVHFAAESHVDRSILGAEAFVKTNVLGTQVLLDLAREWDVERYLQVSTDEVYGELDDTGLFEESMPLLPNSPYSASKAGGDLLVRSYFETHKMPVLITRCSNNYGPYQFPEKLIPLMILNALEDKPLPVYGTGTNVRDWIYVKDHCLGVEAVLQKGRLGEVYNLGGQSEKQNLEVVKSLLSVLNKPESLITYVEDRKGHDYRYAIDFSKAETELGWTPTVTFEEGLQSTVTWYLENRAWWEALQARSVV